MLFLLVLPVSALAKGVVLNFTDVDISTMVKFISDLTGKNFVMDDRVKGKISVFSPAKLTTEEAYNVFTSVLELKGFTVVQAGKVLKIIPTGAAKQSGMNILSGKERSPVNEAYLARIITLENISSQEAMSFLQPLISKDAYISAFGPGNMLLLVDSSINIQKILNILHLVDTDQKREGAELVFLKNASAENAAAVIRDWLGGKDKGGRPAGQAAPTGGSTVLADTRLNALILFGNSNDKQDIKRLINQIDVAPPTTSSKVNVYYLENADATEIAKVLDGVVKRFFCRSHGTRSTGSSCRAATITIRRGKNHHHPRQNNQFISHHGLPHRLPEPAPGGPEAGPAQPAGLCPGHDRRSLP